ncbi:ASCH domain-containing protein [Rhizobium sp. 768_B6_N1_8]|uniref:ASCH domain-containing protein n=1 Tax=unclassified Rhizobium TaxID=2613769 RepID=UPI003F215F14
MIADEPYTEGSWEKLDRFSFGDEPKLADQLLNLVLCGLKTATCWPIEEGQQTEVGRRSVACDGAGRPRAVLETVLIEQMAFDEIGQEFAAKEGEGDASLHQWRTSHREYFERAGIFRPDLLLWCETFRLVSVIEAERQ